MAEESLGLLASAAEQSPQLRIKRNTACVSCRDSKVKCNASSVPGQPCLRCTKLKLQCVVDKSHKRVSRRSKLEELVQEVQSIKEAVKTNPLAQIPLPPVQPTLPSPRADQSSLRETSASRTPVSANYQVPLTRAFTYSEIRATTPTLTAQNTPTSIAKVSEPRALKSRVFSGQDIDFYFDKYFEHFHPYFPLVRTRDPDTCYKAGPILFWVVIVTACRRYARDDTVFPFLVEALQTEIWASVAVPPMALPTVNALLLLCAWPLSGVRFLTDPSNIYSSVAMNACFVLGLHTGQGGHPEHMYPSYRLAVTDEEAVYTWSGYNIISQRVCSYSGFPPTGQFFNRAIEAVLDHTCSIQVPVHFTILLETARFLNKVSRTMSAALEGAKGVSHHIVSLLEDDFDRIQRVISEDISDIDQYTLLSALLDAQIYYFMPLAGFSIETFKRNTLRCNNTAKTLVRHALKLQSERAFLTHAPHYVCRTLLTAACVEISVFLSPYVKDTDGLHSGDPDVQDVLTALRSCSVQEGDMPQRAAKMLENCWMVRHLLSPTEISGLGQSRFSHRLSMSLALDCMRRWKREIDANRPQSTPLLASEPPRPAAAIDPNADPAFSDPFQRIDWNTFMEDFDWSFDPNFLSTATS